MITGIFLRHIKAYKGINYIPISHQYNFVSYTGENGIGKSSILEGIDSFLNNKLYSVNKDSLKSQQGSNNPFFVPIFCIEKNKVTKQKKDYEALSSIFWDLEKSSLTSVVQGYTKEFFEIRELLSKENITKKTHYLFCIGETNLNLSSQYTASSHKLSFGSFQKEKSFNNSFLLSFGGTDLTKEISTAKWKGFLSSVKDLYSYVYLPVEMDIESFTKIETDEMQKIFDKGIKDEIKVAIKDFKLKSANGLNSKLKAFTKEIEETLNGKYAYDTTQDRNNNVTENDLVEKIIEVFFMKRLLFKKDGDIKKQVSELSAGEKRQALINLVYAFLKRNFEREKMVIIGIDEPENSLHTSLCYDQFEMLKEVSDNSQILITTHWYGFLPIIDIGVAHFLDIKGDRINFESYDLYDYKSKVNSDIAATRSQIPSNFSLKSINDLVQSIFYSLKKNEPYNWLIVEGVSEKKYFEFFLEKEIKNKKLRILPLGGQNKVSTLYEHLSLPIKDEKNTIEGKVFCLVDTDKDRHKETIDAGYNNLKLRRLSNGGSPDKTLLLTMNNSDTSITDIEQSLDPIIFQDTINALSADSIYTTLDIQNKKGNTDFINNLGNLKIKNFFSENSGENKIIFAEKYVELAKLKKKYKSPDWVLEIKNFFN